MEYTSPSPLAVVTGASSGIGRELARQFAQHGFDLFIASEDAGIAATADELRAIGTQVDSAQIDLTTYDGVEELCRRVRSLDRPVDALALNAGIGVIGEFLDNDLDAELEMIDLNVKSTVHAAKRLIPDMVARRQGRVLITSSIAAETPGPYEAVYHGTKAFEQSFAIALRHELKDTGVTVTALQPGPTETNFFHRAGGDDTKIGVSEKDDPAVVAREGYEALMAGHDYVVAGSFKNKAEVAMSHVVPDTAGAAQVAKQTKPGSA
ncbi:MAG TPA: SDR family NAD(P)-dependent oxidoreductase [Gemmatimonadaceae bacterium]|nr:SDR family NAD(P)-dependent oxidoreductase [Gemmatimonadaceae bacterium]